MGKYRKYIEFTALALLAVGLVWWFGRSLNWGHVISAVRQSDWRLILLACVIITLGYLWRAFRWQALLSPLCRAGALEIWKATTMGFAAVLLIGRAGEVVRPVVLPVRDRRVRPAAAFVTIVIERVYDIMTVLFAFSVSLVLLTPPPGAASAFASVQKAGWIIAAFGVLVIGMLVLFRLRSELIIDKVCRVLDKRHWLPVGLKRALISLLDQLARALSIMTNARELAVTIGWSLALWSFVVMANLLVFHAFDLRVANQPFGPIQAVFILGWSMVGSAVPTPGGAAGAFHAATGAALVLLGVEKEQAAATAIVLHLVDFGPAAAFGLFYFVRGEVSLARLLELTKPEAVEHAVEDEPITPVESKALSTLEAK